MSKQKVTLASFISSQREKMGNISQVELAQKCGVPAGTIASIESGYAKSPRPVTLKKLAEGLSVPAEIIFKLASNPEKEMFIGYDEMNISRIVFLGSIPTKEILKPIDNADNMLPFPIDFFDEVDFLLTVSGDSLIEEDIYDGDYITIIKQDFLKRSGDLMLCYVENITTLNRVYKSENNFKIKDKIYSKEEITFIGKACMSVNRQKL